MNLAGLAAFAVFSSVAAAQNVPPPASASTVKSDPQNRLVTKPVAHAPKHSTSARPATKAADSRDPAPDVKLILDAAAPRGGWTMRVMNEGGVPVRLVADARLLSLDVTPRGERRPVHCDLPIDMRPPDDASRALVLPPGRSYIEPIAPLMMCLGGRQLDALAQGATVVGHLGWTAHDATRPPFVVAPIDGVEPLVAPLKTLVSPPITLPDEPTPPLLEAAPQERPDDPERHRLSLLGQQAVDASSPSHLVVTVTLRNDGKRPVTVRFRPETLAFYVSAASGKTELCRWPLSPVAAMRDLFTTIRPQGSQSLTLALDAYCGGHLFDRPGLFFVRSQLDTRNASGADIALPTFDGLVVSHSVTLVRLHEGLKPVPLMRPSLEPFTPPPP